MKDQQRINPHDKFFKEAFSRYAVFRSFVEFYLLKRIDLKLDLQNLQPSKDDSVNSDLREFFTDRVFYAKEENSYIPVRLLFEHKSFVESDIFMQLQHYITAIEEDYRKDKHGPFKYVNIIPIVIYNGTDDWNVPQSVVPLYPHLEGAARYIPEFKYELFDISHMPDEEIKGPPLLRVVFFIMKYIQSTELEQKIDEILVILKESDDPEIETFIESFSLYIENAAPKDLRKGLLEKIRRDTLLREGIKCPQLLSIFEKRVEKRVVKKDVKKDLSNGILKLPLS